MRKKLLKQIFSLFTGLLITFGCASQVQQCDLEISLLTCAPGEDLYSIFGHSALRVKNKALNTDVVYNYGTFDFDDPDFYVKFVRGKLLYYVSTEDPQNFIYSYQLEKRWVTEQILNLTCEEKLKLAEALRANALEENKYYLYEFLFDNCSTRLRDIVNNSTGNRLHFKRIISSPSPTFRNMLHEYLDRGEKYWSKFGIDLLLASRIDRKVLNEESMFLPEFLMKGFDSASISGRPLVGEKKEVLPAAEMEENGFSFTPLMLTSLLLVVGILLFVFRAEKYAKLTVVFDGVFFFILGLMGCLMLFMWYGTDHELCRNNYNLYWALPTHLIAAFFTWKNTSFTRRYFSISAILACVFVLSWPFLPQGMNSAFFPLVLLAAIRSLHRAVNKK